MSSAPFPSDEPERLRALEELDVLDSAPDAEFDALAAAAALVCDVPISLVSLVDDERQWFKANVGLPGVTQTSREVAFCAHAILQDDIFEVPDASADRRFAANPLVTGDPDIRFYAGAPLRLSDGARVGTLCVIDRVPRRLSEQQRQVLRHLSAAAVRALETRRQARAFVSSEMRFRALSDAAPLGVFAADSAGLCTYTNRRWRTIFGLSEEAALADGWLQAVHPDDRPSVAEAWRCATSMRLDLDLEFRVLRADGTACQVRALSSPVAGPDGEITGHVGSVEDVTERRRTRRALDEERQRLASIIEGTGAGTWEWNVQTGETRFNERWAEIVGRSLADLEPTTANTWAELCHPGDLKMMRSLLHSHVAGQLPLYECEARMRHSNGDWVWVHTVGRVMTHTAQGEPEWMFGTHVDITPRKLQEERLRKSEELLNATGALARVGGWVVEIPSGQISWSEQTCLIHGVEPGYQPRLDEAIEFYAPEARPTIEAAVARAMKDGQGWDLELPFVQRGGQRIWVRAVGHAEFEDGIPVRLLGAFQDVTESVQAKHALERAHERLALAADSGAIGVWELDTQTGWMLCDARMYALYGRPEGSGVEEYTEWTQWLHPDDLARTEGELRHALVSGTDFSSEFRAIWPDGSVRFIRAAGRISRDSHQRVHRMTGVNWDVTPQRELNARLAEQHELLRVTLNSIGDAVITTDAKSQVTWLNPAAERMTGWLSADAIGRPLSHVFHIVHEETRVPMDNPVSACLANGKVAGLAKHTLLISRDDQEFGIEDSAAPILGPDGEILGVVMVFHDVTEQRRMSGEMSYRATHDPLTGLVNRAEFEARLHRILDKSHEDHSQHALLYIDLDQFKLVNDACGHTIGDQLLQSVAKLLRDTVRTRDTLARLGGDEFAVILEHCSSDQAQRVAQQICDKMEEFRFLHEERKFRIGTSIGLVPVDARWATTTAVMQAADSSCYAAKEAGRNRVHAWLDTDQAIRARHGEMQWAARLEQALDENRFALFAQRIEPLADAPGGVHAEVLVRLREPDGSLVLPGAFLPAAERFNLATRIDRWVLKRAVAYIQSLPELNALGTLCINLSGQSVGDRAFHRHAMEVLSSAGAEVCQRICLEITETAAVTNIADAAVFTEMARKLGVQIALDDFGAGASSFGYLKSLNVDVLKIDGSFIRDLVDDPLDDAAVRCFVDVARVVGVKTVAEFVDRREVLNRVRDIGIDYAQGFLLHRPEPLEKVISDLALVR